MKIKNQFANWGKWQFRKSSNCRYQIFISGEMSHQNLGWVYGDEDKEARANAELIVSAPELWAENKSFRQRIAELEDYLSDPKYGFACLLMEVKELKIDNEEIRKTCSVVSDAASKRIEELEAEIKKIKESK